MRLQFLRGACVIITVGGVRILCDPWLEDGEYYGSWAHYPPFDWGEADFNTIDYIYISHIHPDHFSPLTLRKLPKKPVLIHKFQAPFLKRNIEELGFYVNPIPHGHPVYLNDNTKITIYAADDCDPKVCGIFFSCAAKAVESTQIDSLCVIEGDGQVLVNANDCPYQLSRNMLPRLKAKYPSIDLLLVAYGGAGPYPQCFVMEDERKLALAKVKERSFIDHAIAFAKDLGAKAVFPFAGDYVLQGKLAPLNKYRGVPEVEEVYWAMEKEGINVLMLRPGEERGISETNVLWHMDLAPKRRYIKGFLSGRALDYEGDPEPTHRELSELFKFALKRYTDKCKELGFETKTRVAIKADDMMFMVPSKKPEGSLTIGLDPRLLARILRGPKYAHWNNAEIGSHLTFRREPDVFERGLHHVLSFLHA